MDVSHLSFFTVLLLEQVQLSWFPGWLPEERLAIALKANPIVEWYLRQKCPQLNDWLDQPMATAQTVTDRVAICQAEIDVLASMADLVVYAVDPAIDDTQPFLNWDFERITVLSRFLR